MDFEDEHNSPRTLRRRPRKNSRLQKMVRFARTIEVTRETEGSKFVQTVSLTAGDAGNRVEFGNVNRLAYDGGKSESYVFRSPLQIKSPLTTGISAPSSVPMKRRANSKLRHISGSISPIKPARTAQQFSPIAKRQRQIRTTTQFASRSIRTPGTRGGYQDQGTQDLGHHEINFGIAGHEAIIARVQTDWQACRFNQPLIAFRNRAHPARSAKNFRCVKIDNPRVRVLAMKKAEESDDVIIRMVELDGKPQQNVQLNLPRQLFPSAK